MNEANFFEMMHAFDAYVVQHPFIALNFSGLQSDVGQEIALSVVLSGFLSQNL